MIRYVGDFLVIFLTINTASAHEGQARGHWMADQCSLLEKGRWGRSDLSPERLPTGKLAGLGGPSPRWARLSWVGPVGTSGQESGLAGNANTGEQRRHGSKYGEVTKGHPSSPNSPLSPTTQETGRDSLCIWRPSTNTAGTDQTIQVTAAAWTSVLPAVRMHNHTCTHKCTVTTHTHLDHLACLRIRKGLFVNCNHEEQSGSRRPVLSEPHSRGLPETPALCPRGLLRTQGCRECVHMCVLCVVHAL